MIKRFQIDDILNQDAHGIIYRCNDILTGKTVALRRFFPFGPDGDGLSPDEQAAYNVALSRLAEISHPHLRRIVTGGCDPVDGMPFIVAEWLEEPTLMEIVEANPLPAAEVFTMLGQALDACEALSSVLATEALWIDVDPASIVRSEGNGPPVFSFWISPLKWLGNDETARGFDGLIDLVQKSLKWKRGPVTDQMGNGLGGWISWLKRNGRKAKLAEVRDILARIADGQPAPPTGPPARVPGRSPTAAAIPVAAPKPAGARPAAQPQRPQQVSAPQKTGSSVWVVILLLVILLVGGAGAAWYLFMGPGKKANRLLAPQPVEEKSALDILPSPESSPPPAN
ncbi:MAG: hypothetical protein V4733_08540 [Verrucomicrobiota bacterium]